MQSIVEQRGRVTFPANIGERLYMIPFRKGEALPDPLKRWAGTIGQMLEGIEPPGPVYFMADQGQVRAGQAHRRPGKHVDGNWLAAEGIHGNPPGHGHRAAAGRWNNPPAPTWGHFEYKPEAIILASDVFGARAYRGGFETDIGPGGECYEVDTSTMEAVDLRPFSVWAGNVTMLHESLPLCADAARTVVRLSVPGWEPRA